MQRHAVIVLLLIAVELCLSTANPAKCSRMPEGTSSNKSPPDGRFRLRIINDPIRFIPGESYNSKSTHSCRYLIFIIIIIIVTVNDF
jgi:hypothetical protein